MKPSTTSSKAFALNIVTSKTKWRRLYSVPPCLHGTTTRRIESMRLRTMYLQWRRSRCAMRKSLTLITTKWVIEMLVNTMKWSEPDSKTDLPNLVIHFSPPLFNRISTKSIFVIQISQCWFPTWRARMCGVEWKKKFYSFQNFAMQPVSLFVKIIWITYENSIREMMLWSYEIKLPLRQSINRFDGWNAVQFPVWNKFPLYSACFQLKFIQSIRYSMILIFCVFHYLIGAWRTMKDLSQHTQVGPASRIDRLLAFNRRLSQSQDSARHLSDWSLGLDPTLVKIPARILPYPDLVFGNDRK